MSVDSVIPIIIKYKFTIIFYSLVFLLVYLNRKKFDFQGKFIALYRTKIGIKLMNYISKKANKFIKYFGYAGIVVGFAGMIFTFVLIVDLTYKLILNVPGSGGVSPVLPGLPIAGTGLYFPLITGWIAIFIIIIIHEFSHGFVSLAHDINVKHSGIAFFGPILGAFVEPDEKKLIKEKDSVQNSVFAAGSFSNLMSVLVINIIVILIFAPIINALVFSTGVVISPQPGFPAEKAGVTNNTVIIQINGVNVTDSDDFQEMLKDIGVNETVKLSSENKTFVVTTTEHPEKPSQGYLGIWILGNKSQLKNEGIITKTIFRVVNWILTLLVWVAFLSLNIGLINLLPIFITDGARMLKVACDRFFNKKLSMSIWLNINWLCVLLILILLFLPLLRWINANLSSILFNLFV
jgi:membrane-associated protease RseP (regulator of RpoE activity)